MVLAVDEPADHTFTAGTSTDAETGKLLGRWARRHRARVVLRPAGARAAAATLMDEDVEERRSRLSA
jgi:hypothetical protein